ncbi:hypothetical protein H4R34_004058 [Dimargaris verticillata]|uniref:O-methyltransferase n=1 Tax=Dimargaris verticillata TaxID=2761393 RepID=A0A9W8E7L7_9FUNG|nr:hypothetical protein H4R34_004058 [Dimargaris verticillata]
MRHDVSTRDGYCWDHSTPNSGAPGAVTSVNPTESDKYPFPFPNAVDPSLAHIDAIRVRAFKEQPDLFLMLISPTQGQALYWFVTLFKPRAILEIGSFVGYSLAWLAEGYKRNLAQGMVPPLAADGQHPITSFELDPMFVDIINDNMQRGKLDRLAKVYQGPAQASLENLAPGTQYDLIFIDADKSGYISYYETILRRKLLAPGGLILCDNTLMFNQVHGQYPPVKRAWDSDTLLVDGSQDQISPDCSPHHIYQFNKHVANDPRTEQLLLPIFDGLTIIRVKE